MFRKTHHKKSKINIKKSHWHRDYSNDILKDLKSKSTSDFFYLVVLVKNVKVKNVCWLD